MSDDRDPSEVELVVEVHVPLTPDEHAEEGGDRFPWIDAAMEFLDDASDDDAWLYDESEEFDGEYLFFLSGTSESAAMQLARRLANRPGMPAGAYVLINDSEGDMGVGPRVEL